MPGQLIKMGPVDNAGEVSKELIRYVNLLSCIVAVMLLSQDGGLSKAGHFAYSDLLLSMKFAYWFRSIGRTVEYEDKTMPTGKKRDCST